MTSFSCDGKVFVAIEFSRVQLLSPPLLFSPELSLVSQNTNSNSEGEGPLSFKLGNEFHKIQGTSKLFVIMRYEKSHIFPSETREIYNARLFNDSLQGSDHNVIVGLLLLIYFFLPLQRSILKVYVFDFFQSYLYILL